MAKTLQEDGRGVQRLSVGGAGQGGSWHSSLKCRIINKIDWHEGKG